MSAVVTLKEDMLLIVACFLRGGERRRRRRRRTRRRKSQKDKNGERGRLIFFLESELRGWFGWFVKTKETKRYSCKDRARKRRDHVEIVRELTVVMISEGGGGGVLWGCKLTF